MRIVLDSSDLAEKGGAFYSILVQGSKEALTVQAGEAYNRIVGGAYWKNQTGATRASFRITRPAALAIQIASTSKVARFLDAGTKAHRIEARRAPQLVFFWARMGVMFYGRKVNHPGTKAKRFVHIEAARGLDELHAKIENVADGASTKSGLS